MDDRMRHVVVHGVLVERGRVLLGLRRNTGYADGWWALPSGRTEGRETMTQALVRELHEELGVVTEAARLIPLYFEDSICEGFAPHLHAFFLCRQWAGSPSNHEPEKCDQWRWHEPAALTELAVPPHVRRGLTRLTADKPVYGEHVGVDPVQRGAQALD